MHMHADTHCSHKVTVRVYLIDVAEASQVFWYGCSECNSLVFAGYMGIGTSSFMDQTVS